MDIYARPGTKVKFEHFWGYDSDIERAKKYLKKGAIYTVEKTEVDAFYTDVFLKEIPSVPFNSVMFKED